jgi:hypothetical protein
MSGRVRSVIDDSRESLVVELAVGSTSEARSDTVVSKLSREK